MWRTPDPPGLHDVPPTSIKPDIKVFLKEIRDKPRGPAESYAGRDEEEDQRGEQQPKVDGEPAAAK